MATEAHTSRKQVAYDADYSMLPEHMRRSVRGYIEDGHPVGDFLTAVICNDLKESFARADEENTAAMLRWVSFFYNEAPAPCWGSAEKMKAWIEKGGLRGR